MSVNHHTVMAQVGRADRRFLLATVGLLMCIAFIPFPTRLAAEHISGAGARDGALAYGFTLTATAVMFSVIWFYASIGGRLLRHDRRPARRQGHQAVATYPGPWIYLAATLIAFASPEASLIIYLAIAGVLRASRARCSAGGQARLSRLSPMERSPSPSPSGRAGRSGRPPVLRVSSRMAAANGNMTA